MTGWFLTWWRPWAVSSRRGARWHTAIAICAYVLLYIFLDWISLVQELPGFGFTLWNPPPAASIALLLLKGLRFAPALFVAGVISDGLLGNSALGIRPTLEANLIIAGGYTAVAAALRRYAHAGQELSRVADVALLLLITVAGTVGIAGAVVAMVIVTHTMPSTSFFLPVQHFFIGDLTGIVGLLPVLLTLPLAWARWKDLSPASRTFDIGVFALGLGLALWLVFGVARAEELQYFYLLLIPVVWIGARHGLPWCAVAILVEQLALISTITQFHYSPIDFLAFQRLSLAVAATGLILGAVVTERERVERSLRREQAELARVTRFTTAGALGTAVVHEISQPLASSATYAHICRSLLASTPTDLETLDRAIVNVESEIGRAGDIVARLRDFFGKGGQTWSPIDLEEVTQKVVTMLADDALTHDVDIRVDSRRLPRVVADPVQIEQVLMNLVRNAIEAVTGRGAAERRVRISLRLCDDEIEVAVADNGPGVPADIAEHLFEPFETTKPEGMGLGLSLSRDIVKAHHGSLRWDATFVAGARFVMRLPLERTPGT